MNPTILLLLNFSCVAHLYCIKWRNNKFQNLPIPKIQMINVQNAEVSDTTGDE